MVQGVLDSEAGICFHRSPSVRKRSVGPLPHGKVREESVERKTGKEGEVADKAD